jgi:ketosteroid isomerase-like protein
MRRFLVAILLLQPAAPMFSHKRQPPVLPTRQYADDMRAKNIEDILSLYTPGATFTDPDGNTFSTPDAMRKLYEQVFAAYDSDLTFTVKNQSVNGDGYSAGTTAVESDDYEETLQTRATKTMQQVCGDCIFTWVRQADGVWLMSSQKWTVRPCAASPAK